MNLEEFRNQTFLCTLTLLDYIQSYEHIIMPVLFGYMAFSFMINKNSNTNKYVRPGRLMFYALCTIVLSIFIRDWMR